MKKLLSALALAALSLVALPAHAQTIVTFHLESAQCTGYVWPIRCLIQTQASDGSQQPLTLTIGGASKISVEAFQFTNYVDNWGWMTATSFNSAGSATRFGFPTEVNFNFTGEGQVAQPGVTTTYTGSAMFNFAYTCTGQRSQNCTAHITSMEMALVY